ncbi:MAG: A/G-specific adenine glycosylase [Bacteroides sp.]
MKQFAELLLTWYKAFGRHLPWRESRDPYRIWISEIILQQTRVEQGMDYYLRFVERFPDVVSLAAASLDEVMKYWQGLGYYSRARHLHEAARSIQGAFPRTYEEVRALSGVGDYTAAAICSFAYDLPCAVVDGNVYRVLTRFFGIDRPIDTAAGKREVGQLAQTLLSKEHPADFNQAIMDFGALVCTPRQPRCEACPFAGGCRALEQQAVEAYPVKSHKTKVTDRYFHYIYVRAGAYTFFNKRQADDIWKGLYELPLVESDAPLSVEQLVRTDAFARFLAPGEEPQVEFLQQGIKHQLSHRTIHASFFQVVLPEDTRSFSTFLRTSVAEVENYAVPRLIQAFFEKYL